MKRDNLKIVPPPADVAERGYYLLDDQAGFLMRVAMQRHTSIFTSRHDRRLDPAPVRGDGQAL